MTARLSWDPKGDGLVPQREMPRPVPRASKEPTCLDDHQCVCMYAFTRFPRGCEVFDLFPTLFLGWQSRPQEFVSRARRLDIVSCWVPCTMFSADTSASPTVWLLILIPFAIHNFVTNCFGHGSQFEHSKFFSCSQYILSGLSLFLVNLVPQQVIQRGHVSSFSGSILINCICRSNSCSFHKFVFIMPISLLR